MKSRNLCGGGKEKRESEGENKVRAVASFATGGTGKSILICFYFEDQTR